MEGNPFLRETAKITSSIFDVETYLQQSGRVGICSGPDACDRWSVEPLLIKDLQKSQGKQRTLLRGLIRARSNFPPRYHGAEDILASLNQEKKLHDPEWFLRIKTALQNDLSGAELEPLVSEIEDEYNALMARWRFAEDKNIRHELAQDLDALRPLRDWLYLKR